MANGADYDSAMLIGGLQGLLDAGMSKAMGGFGIKDINGKPQNLAGLMAEKLCSSDFGKFIGKSMINAALDEGVEALGMYVTPYLRRATYDPNAEPLSDEQFAEAVLMGYLTKTVTNLALSYPGFLKGLKKANPGEAIDIPDEANEEADKAMGKLKERAEQIGALEAGGETEAPRNKDGTLEAGTDRMAGEVGDNTQGVLGDDAELSGRQKGEREPLMLPAAEERKMLPAGEERKLLPSGESDEKTMMAAFEGNTGQNQPIGVDAEIPAGAKAGEATFIEGAKDKTAEGMAKMVADENGIPLSTQAVQPEVTTGASAGNRDILGAQKNEIPIDNIPSGSLDNVEARKWYLEQERRIPEQIDKSLPLEEQAKQAFDLRNQCRTRARELMSDRALAKQLNQLEPNLSWEQIVQKQIDKGLSGDEIYQAIIESSQRSRKSVNKELGLD